MSSDPPREECVLLTPWSSSDIFSSAATSHHSAVTYILNENLKHILSQDLFVPPTDGQGNLQQSVHSNTERFECRQMPPQSTPIVTDTLRFETFLSVSLLLIISNVLV